MCILYIHKTKSRYAPFNKANNNVRNTYDLHNIYRD